MPRHSYRFMRSQRGSGSSTPLVPIILSNPIDQVSQPMYALVDTGADCCVVPSWAAELLGHDLEGDGVRSNDTEGVGGILVPTFLHTFQIGLLDPDLHDTVYTTPDILVSCVEDNTGIVLLGAGNFLFNFHLTVDYPNLQTIFKW